MHGLWVKKLPICCYITIYFILPLPRPSTLFNTYFFSSANAPSSRLYAHPYVFPHILLLSPLYHSYAVSSAIVMRGRKFHFLLRLTSCVSLLLKLRASVTFTTSISRHTRNLNRSSSILVSIKAKEKVLQNTSTVATKLTVFSIISKKMLIFAVSIHRGRSNILFQN